MVKCLATPVTDKDMPRSVSRSSLITEVKRVKQHFYNYIGSESAQFVACDFCARDTCWIPVLRTYFSRAASSFTHGVDWLNSHKYGTVSAILLFVTTKNNKKWFW